MESKEVKTESKSLHTKNKVEWQYKYNRILETGFLYCGSEYVGVMAKEHGEKIEPAINAHDDLVKALQSFIDYSESVNSKSDMFDSPLIANAKEPLKKATE